MNRWGRRHFRTKTGKVLHIGPTAPAGPTISDQPSTVNAHGVCRACSKRTFLWLPGRICTRCVDKAMALSMLAELERMEAEELESV